jgi:phosphate transport system protein
MSTRTRLTEQLEQVNAEVVRIGQLVKEALRQSLEALRARDASLARAVIAGDAAINEGQAAVEREAQTLLATQQPVVATDLRLVRAHTAIVGELERIGDYAKGIAKRAEELAAAPNPPAAPDLLWEQGEAAMRMLGTALEALARRDAALAESLGTADSAVDALEDAVRREVFQDIRANPAWLEAGVALLEAAHALERVADRATNIGERVIFVVHAEYTELNQ